MTIALFEDLQWQNLNPISLTKPTFDIKIGSKSFFEEYTRTPEILLTREYLADVTGERHRQSVVNPSSVDSDTIFVNGLLHPKTIDLDRLQRISHTFAVTAGNRLVLARLIPKDIEHLQECTAIGKKFDTKVIDVEKLTTLEARETEGLLTEPWHILAVLKNSLVTQILNLEKKTDSHKYAKVRIIGKGNAIIDENAEVEEGTVLDTRSGSIYIGPEAQISPSRIIGPAYIGGKTAIKQFTTIESSYIGHNCRIAGEIEHSIISDYSNKAHAGFIGHSYVGEWVNIGAMTTTSDLKMTYGNIKMSSADGKKVDTGHNKLGSFLADMSKTSIGTLIYSGLKIGVSSHLHGLVAHDVPSFTIYGSSIGAGNVELELNSAIETQKKMMSRRGLSMSNAYEQMIKHIFDITDISRIRSSIYKTKFTV